MLLYLSGHSRPDITHNVHQCTRFTFNPKLSHKRALIQIAKYLKATGNRGLIVDPDKSPFALTATLTLTLQVSGDINHPLIPAKFTAVQVMSSHLQAVPFFGAVD